MEKLTVDGVLPHGDSLAGAIGQKCTRHEVEEDSNCFRDEIASVNSVPKVILNAPSLFPPQPTGG